MNETALALEGVRVFQPKKLSDARGYFVETFNAQSYAAAGVKSAFVQDNQSLSRIAGTIRGLHFQRPPAAQAKLVRVLRGAIFDVVVDLRRGSHTYGQWCAATLTAEGGEQIFVPRGFAHAFARWSLIQRLPIRLMIIIRHPARAASAGTTLASQSHGQLSPPTP
jgi:dTDP-4-dehydrorhamnose 3,5-epimerase